MPTETLTSTQEATLSGFVFDRGAADAHVMQPIHAQNIISSRGREEGQIALPHGVPAGGPLAFNTDGFVQALNAALATQTAGYAMELREHGQIIASKVSGGAHLSTDGAEPWTEGICMHVASCSKLVTAIAMTRVLAAHNVSPDTPIIKYLPTYWQKGQNIEKITFRMLMTHTSGFHVVTSDSTYPWMKSQVAAGVTAANLGVYTYENMNYGLCRILLSVMNGNITAGHMFPPASQDSDWDYATIQAYAAYVKQNVFQPSGVGDATLDHPSPDALAYAFPTGSGWNSGDLSTYSGGAGWHLSVSDLLNVMGTVRRAGSIMSTTAAQTMLDSYFGIDVISTTPLGKLYNKNGLWQSGSGASAKIEQTLAYFLPLDMELVVFANSPIGVANTFFRDLVTNIYIANIAPQIGTGGWIAHHNMTGQQYQETFNNLVLNEGMELVDVSGYGPTGNLYAALWVKNANPPAWEAHHGITADQYQTIFNQLTAQGFGVSLVDGYDAGGQPHFAAIFQKGETAPWVARHGMSSADYQSAFDQYVKQGYTLDWVSGYSQGGQAFYAAIWRKITGAPAWQAKHGMTGVEYQQYFNQATAQGYTLDLICGYGVGNQAYYAAIFRKIPNPPAWISHNGMTSDLYQQTFNQLVGQGYRLTQVCGYTVAGQNQFAAIWSK
jgi:CubicO group peptidase (beta-lactamase class C family)